MRKRNKVYPDKTKLYKDFSEIHSLATYVVRISSCVFIFHNFKDAFEMFDKTSGASLWERCDMGDHFIETELCMRND